MLISKKWKLIGINQLRKQTVYYLTFDNLWSLNLYPQIKYYPAPHWGGLFRAPPLVFLRYLPNQCRYHHQTCSTLSPNNFTHCVRILKSRVLWFSHKWRQSDVMFRRFQPKISVYGNRRHGCSFKATINCLIWNDVELVGLQNCYLGFSKFWKLLKISKFFNIFFSFSKFFPLKIKIFKKPYNMLEGNGWWIRVQNFKLISSKMAEIWYETCQKQALFTSFRDFTKIFRVLFFLQILTLQKVLRSFFAFFAKIWSENMYRTSKSRNFLFGLF